MQKWLINGEEGPGICPDDRGFAYGDGLFETIAWREGRARFLDHHLSRLECGCRRLAIPFPGREHVAGQLSALPAGCRSGTLKIILSRGSGPRGYAPPAGPSPTLAIGFDAASEHRGQAPWTAITSSVPASQNACLAGLKTLNRLDSVLARAECVARGATEGIMQDASGQIVGGTMSNLFLVSGGGLVTPSLAAAGVLGVMRGVVMELAARLGIPVSEARVGRDALFAAEELFATNSLIGLAAIRAVDGRPLSVGPVTLRIAQGLATLGVAECRT